MAIYCGVDFHARQQTVCYGDTADGAIHLKELDHQGDVPGFYTSLTGEVIVGLETSGYSTWFIEFVESPSYEVLIGRCSALIIFLKNRFAAET